MTDKPLDLTKPVQTRDGRKVRILCDHVVDPFHPIVGLVDIGDRERVDMWTKDGVWMNGSCEADLVNFPEKHVRFVNLHRTPDGQIVTSITTYADELTAHSALSAMNEGQRGFPHIATVPVEWEE